MQRQRALGPPRQQDTGTAASSQERGGEACRPQQRLAPWASLTQVRARGLPRAGRAWRGREFEVLPPGGALGAQFAALWGMQRPMGGRQAASRPAQPVDRPP